MSKKTKIIIAVIVVIAIISVVAIIVAMSGRSGNEKTNLSEVSSQNDLENLVDKVYKGVSTDMYNVETMDIDLSDDTLVKSYTGLENGEDLEYAVVSEPLINAQAFKHKKMDMRISR